MATNIIMVLANKLTLVTSVAAAVLFMLLTALDGDLLYAQTDMCEQLL